MAMFVETFCHQPALLPEIITPPPSRVRPCSSVHAGASPRLVGDTNCYASPVSGFVRREPAGRAVNGPDALAWRTPCWPDECRVPFFWFYFGDFVFYLPPADLKCMGVGSRATSDVRFHSPLLKFHNNLMRSAILSLQISR